jgi:signal transduction histidine kinase
VTLRSRLILIFLALTLGATTLIGTLAYGAAVDSVNAVTRRTVGILAEDRHAALVQRLVRQHRRGERFLSQAPACTRLPINESACERAVRAFAVEEDLLGAQVVEHGHPIATIRTAAVDSLARHPDLSSDIPLVPRGQLARFTADSAGFAYYDVGIAIDSSPDVAVGGAPSTTADWLLLRYALRPSDPLFATGRSLGDAGESFLADARGRPISRLRFAMSADMHGRIDALPMRVCLAGHDGQMLDADYHGSAIIHGYRYVPEIGGGCIMAHVSQSEATAPVRVIRDRLLTVGALLGLLALLISIVVAREIAAPLTALVESAEAVARGERPAAVAEDGVPEVRTLTRAFTSMTNAIERRTEEREFALAARARFYHSMSHELRTPLNAVVGYLDLLRSDVYGPLPDRAQEAVARSQRAAFLLRDLIDDVLDLAKIEAGRIEVKREPVNLAGLIDDLRATIEPVASAAGVELQLDCDPSLLVDSDAQRIGQIVLNLVSNAIKFAQHTPVVIRCHRPVDGPVTIDVTDHGPGIALDDQARIFDEYVQLHEGARVGTGLGLAISRRLAHALGGSLTVESSLGRGATFRLLLP